MSNHPHPSGLPRREALRIGVGALGFTALARAWPARAADVIEQAAIQAVGEPVNAAPFKKPGPYRIGFSNGFSGNTWRTECLFSIRQEAARQPDVSELIVVDGQGDISKQVNDIENLASQNVDAILCIPNSGAAVAPALRQATKDGIITVPFNLPVDGEDWVTFVGTDPEKKGNALGQFLRGALGDHGKIVALGGLPGNSYTASAWKGAQAAFAGSGIETLAFRDAYWQEDRAKVIMADLINAYPQIDGIWCDGGQVAAGAAKALLAANRPLVPVTGDDYNGLLKLYNDQSGQGQARFKIGLMSEPTWESVVALRASLKLLRGEPVAKRQVIAPRLITAENYKTYVRPGLPDGVFVDTNLADADLQRLFQS